MKATTPVLLALIACGIDPQEPVPRPPQAIPIGEVFAEANTGQLLAGRAYVRRRVGPRTALHLGAHLHSTSYPTPDLAIPSPSDPDGLALARQIGLSIGLSWITRRATAEPRNE